MVSIQKEIALSRDQLSFIVGAVFFGGAISVLFAGEMADKYSRRFVLQIGAVLIIAGLVLAAMASGFWLVFIGRLLQGIGVGFITLVTPLYLVESMPSQLRGSGTSTVQFFLNGGIVLAALISLFLVAGDHWRLMFLIGVIPAIILFIGTFFIPHTPRWLVMRGKIEKAKSVLALTRPDAEADHEFNQILHSFKQTTQTSGYALLKQKKMLLAVLLVTLIGCLNQLTGINVYIGFSAIILKDVGLHSDNIAVLGTVIITAANFLVTLISVLLVDKVGRKLLLKIGLIGLILASLYLTIVATLLTASDSTAYLVLGGIIFFAVCFAIGPGTMIWLLLSELLPNPIRSIGMSIALATLLFASGAYASVFLSFAHTIGYQGVFLFSLVICVFYLFIVIKFVPETKGKSLEEIGH
jgi:MFS transporter, SP family, galactose:H+ symporter